MVLGSVLIQFFYMQLSSFPSTLLKRLSLHHYIFLPPLSKIRYPQVHGFISGLSILFHWSILLFLCQYHTVLMTAALWYNLKSGRLIPPAPFLFLKTALAIKDLLCFHMNCEIFLFQFCERCHWYFDRDCIWQDSHFHNIDPSYSGTWNISLSVYVVF